MLLHKIRGAGAALCVIVYAGWVLADQLTVSGTVKDSAGVAIADAIVTVTSGFGGGGGMMGRAVRDTTDASGGYSITMTDSVKRVNISVTKSGFRTATVTDSVAAPNDGTADKLTVNVTLRSNGRPVQTMDTLVISGTVKDSSGSPVANAIVRSGGGMAGGLRDTTDASGKYSLTEVVSGTTRTVSVTATEGARTGSASGAIPSGSSGKISLTIDITFRGGRINPSRGDSVVITGTVKDSTGKAVAGAKVTPGGGIGLDSAITDASGAFTLKTVNANGVSTLSVMASVSASGGAAMGNFGMVTVRIANPTDGKTDNVTVAIVLGKFTNSILPSQARKTVPNKAVSSIKIYSLDGRSIGVFRALPKSAGLLLAKEEGFQKTLKIR